jgi:hypothetical protein
MTIPSRIDKDPEFSWSFQVWPRILPVTRGKTFAISEANMRLSDEFGILIPGSGHSVTFLIIRTGNKKDTSISMRGRAVPSVSRVLYFPVQNDAHRSSERLQITIDSILSWQISIQEVEYKYQTRSNILALPIQILDGFCHDHLFSWGNGRRLQEATCQKVSRIPGESEVERCQDPSSFSTTCESRICTDSCESWSEHLIDLHWFHRNLFYYLKDLFRNVRHKSLQVSFSLRPNNRNLNDTGSISIMDLHILA